MESIHAGSSEAEAKLMTLTEEHGAVERKMRRLEGDKTMVESALAKIKVELEEEIEGNNKLRSEAGGIQSEVDALKRERDRAKREQQRLTDELKRREGETADSSEFEEKLEGQRRLIADRDTSLKAARESLENERQERATEKREALEAGEKVESGMRDLNRSEAQNKLLEEALSKIKAEIAAEVDSNTELRRQVGVLTAEIETLQRSKGTMEGDMEANISAGLQRAQLELEDERSRVVKAEKEASRVTEEMALVHKQRQALQEVLRDAQAELTKRAHEIAATKDTAERLERELRDQTTESGSQEERMAAVRGELEQARLAARTAKDAFAALESEAQGASRDVMDRLQRENDEAGRKEQETRNTLERELAKHKRDAEETLMQANQAHTAEMEKVENELAAKMRGEAGEATRVLEVAGREKDTRISALLEEVEQAKVDAMAVCRQDMQAEQDRAVASARQAAQMEVMAMEEEKADMEAKLIEEVKKRRLLHNKVIELQGNIRVYCRVRPVNDTEIKTGEGDIVTSYPLPGTINVRAAGGLNDNQRFEFDQVFGPDSTQVGVFEEVQGLITSGMDGYNVTIFAYGQTGTGKTYTMDGPPSDAGVNTRAFRHLFAMAEERKVEGFEYTFKVSMLEIYNEAIMDLLELDKEKRRKLEIRRSAKGSYVEGLLDIDVTSIEDVTQILTMGQKNRSVGRHNMNEHSSRSHLVVSVHIAGTHPGGRTRSVLHMVDLAGSERVGKTDATGDRLKEAQSINKVREREREGMKGNVRE